MANSENLSNEEMESKLSHKITYTDKALTELINRVIQHAADSVDEYYIAVCSSNDHDGGSTWEGTLQTDRREALRDAIDHNAYTGHDASVLGPIA